MAEITVVDKKIRLSLYDIIRFQLTMYCFTNGVKMSPAQLNTLAYLGLWGDMNISDFCDQIVEEDVFGNPQTVRNFILKAIRDGHVTRKGTGNKIICLSDNVEMENEGNIWMKLNVIYAEAEESQGTDS